MLLLVPIIVLCVLIAVLLPGAARAYFEKFDSLPVSVTSLTSAEALSDQLFGSAEVMIVPPFEESRVDTNSPAAYPGLADFTAKMSNGLANEVVGVYVPNLFALPIVQQPSGEPDYVAREHNQITQFELPKEYGSVGLLAHNYLSGSRFFQLGENQDIVLVYGDGRAEHYRVTRIEQFQALKPNSPFSNFVDLDNPIDTLTSASLFRLIYTTPGQLVFQTCIERDGEPSWGRMFVIAEPAEPLQFTVPVLNTARNLN